MEMLQRWKRWNRRFPNSDESHLGFSWCAAVVVVPSLAAPLTVVLKLSKRYPDPATGGAKKCS
jgi:hypothetical protein